MERGLDTKAAVKRAMKRCALTVGGAFRLDGVRILTYHSIGRRHHDMNVLPEDFRAQMEWLANNRRVIPFTEAADGADGVAITFDDGYQDNLANAAPVLKALGLPATFFVVAGCAGGLLEHDRAPETSRLMSWEELAELHSLGFTIGAHTLTHRRLSSLSDNEQRREIIESAEEIEGRLGCSVETFAYPFGSAADYNETSVAIARETFTCAATNRYGVNVPGADRWTLKRIWIDSTDTLDTFVAKVDGRLDALRLLDSRAGLACRRWLNGILHV